MNHFSPARSFTFTPIADTSERFRDFAPYVASINDAGIVAFEAALARGGSGVFIGDGSRVNPVTDSAGGPLAEFYSHPDINRSGCLSFYAGLKSGGQGLVHVRDGQVRTLADTGGPLQSIGPLGPTMNDEGAVAFRADLKSGGSGIFLAHRGVVTAVADTRGRFAGFQGLPVINRKGTVVFRADLKGGGQGIYACEGGSLATVVETGALFGSLGLFPMINDEDTVAFIASLKAGGEGIFAAAGGNIATVLETRGPFERFRGVLNTRRGIVVFYASTSGAELSLYAGPDPRVNRILSIGDPLFGSTVNEMALNPVSVNEAGQVAIRIRLDNGRQVIVRADPAKA